MAKAKGPLFSLQAKGDFNDTLLFQGLQKFNIVRRKVTGDDKQSEQQLDRRALFSAGSSAWKALSGSLKALWKAKAKDFKPNNTGYSYFMSNFLDLGTDPSPWWYPEVEMKGFKLIEEVNLSNANDYTFAGLNGDLHEFYKIDLRGFFTAATAKMIGLRPNGAITNYSKGVTGYHYRGGGTTFADGAQAPIGSELMLPLVSNTPGGNAWILAHGIVQAKTGFVRIIESISMMLKDTVNKDFIASYHSTSAWLDTATNITSLVLHFGGATNFSGKACLFGFVA